MTGPKTEHKARETVIRFKEAQARAALSEVVHEVETMGEGDCDTKLLKVVDDALESAEKRAEEAKNGAAGPGAKRAAGLTGEAPGR